MVVSLSLRWGFNQFWPNRLKRGRVFAGPGLLFTPSPLETYKWAKTWKFFNIGLEFSRTGNCACVVGAQEKIF